MNEEIKNRIKQEFKLESQLEECFRTEVKKAGGWAIKFNSVGTNGLPDRIVFYKGFTWLVELKTSRGAVQPNQKAIHKRFAAYGFKVRIVRDREAILNFIQDMLNIVP